MLLATLAVAAADSGRSCQDFEMEDVLPLPGDFVTADVRPIVVHDDSCADLDVHLVRLDVDGSELGEVGTSVEPLTRTLSRVVPSEPLVDGSKYALDVDGYRRTFEVGPAPPTPDEPPIEPRFTSRCLEANIRHQVRIETRYLDRDDDERGVALLFAAIDGVHAGVVDAEVHLGADELVLSRPLNGRQACVWVRFEDLAGREVWRTDERCSEVVECAEEDVDRGCGCRGAPGGAALAWMGLIVVQGRARRWWTSPRRGSTTA